MTPALAHHYNWDGVPQEAVEMVHSALMGRPWKVEVEPEVAQRPSLTAEHRGSLGIFSGTRYSCAQMEKVAPVTAMKLSRCRYHSVRWYSRMIEPPLF